MLKLPSGWLAAGRGRAEQRHHGKEDGGDPARGAHCAAVPSSRSVAAASRASRG